MRLWTFSPSVVLVDHGVALWIEGDGVDRRPVSGFARPAGRVALASLAVQGMASLEDRPISSCMALVGADVANAAVLVVKVVPTHEIGGPGPCGFEAFEAAGRKLWAVLGGAEGRLGVGVVIADPRPRVGRIDP